MYLPCTCTGYAPDHEATRRLVGWSEPGACHGEWRWQLVMQQERSAKVFR